MTTNNKIELFSKIVKGLFPGLDLSHLKYGSGHKNKIVWNNLHFNIQPANSFLINSPYSYKGKSFVHFTSFFSLNSILQERGIRLYNLHNLNDPREFIFASKIFGSTDKQVEDAKENLYITSFCDEGILRSAASEFNMWRLYGHEGKGVGLVFSVANDPSKWIDFHLSKVYYGTNNRRNLKQLLAEIKNLNQTKPFIDIDFGKIYPFHKSNLFRPESEVRVVFDNRKHRNGMGSRTVTHGNKLIFPIIKSDIFKIIEDNEKVRFLHVPIFREDLNIDEYLNDAVLSIAPLLKIEEIFIGYDYEKVEEITKIIEELCQEQIGYIPKITQTRLRKFYIGA